MNDLSNIASVRARLFWRQNRSILFQLLFINLLYALLFLGLPIILFTNLLFDFATNAEGFMQNWLTNCFLLITAATGFALFTLATIKTYQGIKGSLQTSFMKEFAQAANAEFKKNVKNAPPGIFAHIGKWPRTFNWLAGNFSGNPYELFNYAILIHRKNDAGAVSFEFTILDIVSNQNWPHIYLSGGLNRLPVQLAMCPNMRK